MKRRSTRNKEFYLRVDVWEDARVKAATDILDPTGSDGHIRIFSEVILIKLFAEVAKAGYWLKWDEHTCTSFATREGSTYSVIQNMVDVFVKCNLFNGEVYKKSGVLTTKSSNSNSAKPLVLPSIHNKAN